MLAHVRLEEVIRLDSHGVGLRATQHPRLDVPLAPAIRHLRRRVDVHGPLGPREHDRDGLQARQVLEGHRQPEPRARDAQVQRQVPDPPHPLGPLDPREAQLAREHVEDVPAEVQDVRGRVEVPPARRPRFQRGVARLAARREQWGVRLVYRERLQERPVLLGLRACEYADLFVGGRGLQCCLPYLAA